MKKQGPYFFEEGFIKMRIGLAYDLRTDWEFQENDPLDVNAEFDKPKTIEEMTEALEAGGHEVKRIGNVDKLLAQIPDLGVDIVFNICEGRGGRTRESQVPVILDMYNIPYVGSDGLTLGLTLDKGVAKKCFVADNIPTPKSFVAVNSDNLETADKIGFPLIVKTCHEGTSKGISAASRVEDYQALKRQVDLVTQVYQQPALIEEFIKGTEFTVAVLGNEEPVAMPVVQVSMDGNVNLGDSFYYFEMVSSDRLQYVCPAKASEDLARQMQALAVRVYRSVGCRDLGRVDFRVDDQGNPYVLEINPLPSLSHEDVFNIFPQEFGLTYADAINYVLQLAAHRCGMVERPASNPFLKTDSSKMRDAQYEMRYTRQ